MAIISANNKESQIGKYLGPVKAADSCNVIRSFERVPQGSLVKRQQIKPKCENDKLWFYGGSTGSYEVIIFSSNSIRKQGQ